MGLWKSEPGPGLSVLVFVMPLRQEGSYLVQHVAQPDLKAEVFKAVLNSS